MLNDKLLPLCCTAQLSFVICVLTQCYSCRRVQETFREQLWFRKCLMCFCVLFVEHTVSVLFHDHHFIEGSRNQIQGWNLIISLPYKLLINTMWQFYVLLLLFSLTCSRDATLDDSVSLLCHAVALSWWGFLILQWNMMTLTQGHFFVWIVLSLFVQCTIGCADCHWITVGVSWYKILLKPAIERSTFVLFYYKICVFQHSHTLEEKCV